MTAAGDRWGRKGVLMGMPGSSAHPASPGQPPDPVVIDPCPGCGLVVGPIDGPRHPYIGSSPGCWSLHIELMTSLKPADRAIGQLAGDTYAVQHPGIPERRAVQSVCVHLISLGAQLERGWPAAKAPDLVNRAIGHPDWWVWLDPPTPLGSIRVDQVVAATDSVERDRLVHAWADDLWRAYEPHHRQVLQWIDTLLGPAGGRGGRRR